MKLNFGAAGSKHDKQQQNSMWEATLFTRISVKKKKNRRRRRRRGEFQERRVAKKWKHGKEEIAQQKYSAALYFCFFSPWYFVFGQPPLEKKREHLALSEKKEQKRTFTDFSCGAKGSGIKTSPRQTSRYIWFHTRLPYLFPNVFASR